METDFVSQKQHAHGLIERSAPEKLYAVVSLLEVMLDPLDRALAGTASMMSLLARRKRATSRSPASGLEIIPIFPSKRLLPI